MYTINMPKVLKEHLIEPKSVVYFILKLKIFLSSLVVIFFNYYGLNQMDKIQVELCSNSYEKYKNVCQELGNILINENINKYNLKCDLVMLFSSIFTFFICSYGLYTVDICCLLCSSMFYTLIYLINLAKCSVYFETNYLIYFFLFFFIHIFSFILILTYLFYTNLINLTLCSDERKKMMKN